MEENYKRLIYDSTVWGLLEIAANLGLTIVTVRGYRKDGILCEEDGYASGRPWWHAGTIRRWAIDTGRMTTQGVPQKKKAGRPKGARNRW